MAIGKTTKGRALSSSPAEEEIANLQRRLLASQPLASAPTSTSASASLRAPSQAPQQPSTSNRPQLRSAMSGPSSSAAVKSSTAGPIPSSGVDHDAVVGRQQTIANMLQESEEPRPGQSKANSKGKARRVSPRPDQHPSASAPTEHRPVTPPSGLHQAHVDLIGHFEKLSPRSKVEWLMQGGPDDKNGNKEDPPSQAAAAANPYRHRRAQDHSPSRPQAQDQPPVLKRPFYVSPDGFPVAHKRAKVADDPLPARFDNQRQQPAAPHSGPPQSAWVDDDDDEWLGSNTIPHNSILKRLANAELIPLWHFTEEGMLAGHARGTKAKDFPDSLSGMLDSVAKSAALPEPKRQDADLSLPEMWAAANNMLMYMAVIANDIVDSDKKNLLQQERDGWRKAFNEIFNHNLVMEDPVKNWPTLAEYVDNIRKKIYLRPVGSRIKPFGIRDKLFRTISDNVQKRTAAAELSASIQAASTAAVAAAQAAIHAQLASSNKQSSSGAASGSGGGGSSSKKSKPFRSDPSSQPARRGVTGCIICGVVDVNHKYKSCTGAPKGHDAHAKRDKEGNIVRRSDGSTICHQYNLTGCKQSNCSKGRHECSVCGDTGHQASACSRLEPSPQTPPNHKSATSDLKTLNSAIEKEIGLGRACGPYTKEEVEDLIGPFQTSPLGLVLKPNGKWRMVQDFSYPRKGDYPAINNYIASDEFVCAWHGYWDFVDLARFMPPGSLAAMADASEAFRAVGAAKDQWPGLVILAPSGWFIIDTRLPFGLASATGVWGSVADATLAIIHAHFDTEVGLRAVKWVDDFVFMKPPSSDLLLNDVLKVTEPLGFPWHPEKRSEFASEVRYLGFEFNVHTFVVMLPEDKAAKYRERVLPFTKSGHVRLKDVERVFGCLQHIVIMARDLGPHLADFAEFLGVFDRDDLFQHRIIPARVQDEAKVWLK
ncbi:hypothetical protein CF336_g5741, partial [Tilletia laevis]